MHHIEWIFSGIGTQVLFALAGIISLFAGYKFAVRRRHRQKQNAGRNSIQIQIIDSSYNENENTDRTDDILQQQTAGNNSFQFQKGKRNGIRQ